VIASYEQSSIFGLVISNEGKKFYNIDTWWSKAASCMPGRVKITVLSNAIFEISSTNLLAIFN
jgi:hypothetical protein